jgi:hypothetical protein
LRFTQTATYWRPTVGKAGYSFGLFRTLDDRRT